MVAVAFQLIVRWCWTISCERFFEACRRSQNYDVILGYSKTNQRTSCITYIHNIYLQWYLQQAPKLFSIILMKQTAVTFLVKASSLNPDLPIPSASSRHLHPLPTNQLLAKFCHRVGGHLDTRFPVSLQQQCSSNRHKSKCSSSSVGGSSKGNSSRSNMYILAHQQQQLGCRMVHIKHDPGQCMCKRSLRSPRSAYVSDISDRHGPLRTSHAATTDLCPCRFVRDDGHIFKRRIVADPSHMVYIYQTPRPHAKSVYNKVSIYTVQCF